jgi:hypothetical protein
METNIKPGQIYKHFKGDTYKILTLAKSSQTEEWVVVYERQTDITHTGWKIWVRPVLMFQDQVDTPDYKGPRFEYVSG